MTNSLRDKFRGVMLGTACGDALGAQIEFKTRDTYPEQRDMTGGGPFNLQPGQWTDDTAMALVLAEYLAIDPALKAPRALASRWLDWADRGIGSCTGHCFDIGTQTRSSLNDWTRYGKHKIVAKDARGNGALMRVAPVAISSLAYNQNVRDVAKRQALITHNKDSAELCADFAHLLTKVVGFSAYGDFTGALRAVSAACPHAALRDRRDVDSTGYDVATYEAAIWAVRGAVGFEEAVCRAVNLGHDADTVGAVTGALAGALWGAEAIPERWLAPLAWRYRIQGVADDFWVKVRV